MQQLENLKKQLKQFGLDKQSSLIENILKFSNYQEELGLWKNVINATNEQIPSNAINIINFTKQNYNKMLAEYNKFSQLSNEELKYAISLAISLPKSNNENANDYIMKYADNNITKYSGFFSSLGNKALKIVPVIGFLFSFILALKNFIYGIDALYSLLSTADNIDLDPRYIFNYNLISDKVNFYKNDPDKMIILARINNLNQVFYDELISLVANSIDFIKDVIFLILDTGSFGLMTLGDIGLSFLFMFIEMSTENQILPEFDKIRNEILRISHIQIKSLSMAGLD